MEPPSPHMPPVPFAGQPAAYEPVGAFFAIILGFEYIFIILKVLNCVYSLKDFRLRPYLNSFYKSIIVINTFCSVSINAPSYKGIPA